MRGITSSAVSKVVKRSPHFSHSRRRRTCCPSPERRESMTFVSSWLQKGQCIRSELHAAAVHGELLAHGPPLLLGAGDDLVITHVVQDVRDPAGQLPELRFLEAAGGGGRRTQAQARGDH